MDDCADLEKILAIAKKTLSSLETKKAGYDYLSMPSDLEINLEKKQEEVADLENRLAKAQLARIKEQKVPQISGSHESPMRSRVADEHYIERQEAKRLLGKFADAIKQPDGQPLLFNICGIGGVGKTTLLGRLKDAHVNEVDFLEVCFAKNKDSIETPLKLMRKLHQQAIDRFGRQAIPDSFTQQEELFEKALFELSRRSIDGEAISNDETTKIIGWFERFVWLGAKGLTFTPNKSKSFDGSGLGFSSLSVTENDTENRQELMQQLVRNHPATKDKPELQSLMLEPVSKLTQAFAESMMQISHNRGRSLVLILDTYEKAQPYLNQWLWQYLVVDTPLYSSSVRLVVVGRRSLQADEGWRKLNQDRRLLHGTPLIKFSKPETENYLKKIGIEKGSTIDKIYKVTQGLPYYLDWVRDQREQGNDLDFSKGNQAISDLLFQGIDANQQKILQVVSCCRWFNLSMIRYLLGNNELGLQRDNNNVERYFEWLKLSDFIEFTKGHFCFDDVARDVFRQSYFQTDQDQFRKTNALLANYFKLKADELFDPQSLLPDPYKDEEWRELISEFLYYGLFGKGREGLLKYIEHIFTSVYLQEPDVFIAPFAFICGEISEENQNLLPRATDKFFKDSNLALGFGWHYLNTKNYKIQFEGEEDLSEDLIKARLKKTEDSLQALLEYADKLQDGFGKCIGSMSKSLRCSNSREITNLLLQSKGQSENLLTYCRPKLMHSLFSNIGRGLLQNTKCYEDSLDCYQKALELYQGNILTFLEQATVLCCLERYQESLESSQKAIDLDPKSVVAWLTQSRTLNYLERYQESLESSQKAIDLNTKSVNAWLMQSRTLKDRKYYMEALTAAETALEIEAENIDALNDKALTLSFLKNFEKALIIIDKAINLDAKLGTLLKANRSIILARAGQYTEALAWSDQAINQDPKHESSYYSKACCYALQGYIDQSIENLRKAIDIKPHHSRTEAKHNPDFDGIRDDERFQALVYPKT